MRYYFPRQIKAPHKSEQISMSWAAAAVAQRAETNLVIYLAEEITRIVSILNPWPSFPMYDVCRHKRENFVVMYAVRVPVWTTWQIFLNLKLLI